MVASVQEKFRQALGAIKDHTSIGIAKIASNPFSDDPFSAIEIAVVKATSHDQTPIEEKYVHEILFLVSNSPGSVTSLAGKISRRLEKTHDWIVALKILMLIHRLLRGGDRNFEQDLRKARFSGDLRLDLQNFSHSSGSSVSFLHDYAAFLEERMGWFINQAGKLESTVPETSWDLQFSDRELIETVFYRLPKCQELLDRIMECFPAKISCSDRLIPAALSNVLRESFQVYQSFCDGVATLLDSFFDFKVQMEVLALKIFKRAASQSYRLAKFFDNCKKITGTKNLDYPSIQIISEDHVSTMEQFLEGASSESGKSEIGSFSSKSDLSFSPISIPSKPLQIHNHEDKPNSSELKNSREKTLEVAEQHVHKKNRELIDLETEHSNAPAKKIEDQTSVTLFSWKWETKISTEWVDFGEDSQNSGNSAVELGDYSLNTIDDLLLLGGTCESDNSTSNNVKSCSYNPFVELVSPCYFQLEDLTDKQGNFLMLHSRIP